MHEDGSVEASIVFSADVGLTVDGLVAFGVHQIVRLLLDAFSGVVLDGPEAFLVLLEVVRVVGVVLVQDVREVQLVEQLVVLVELVEHPQLPALGLEQSPEDELFLFFLGAHAWKRKLDVELVVGLDVLAAGIVLLEGDRHVLAQEAQVVDCHQFVFVGAAEQVVEGEAVVLVLLVLVLVEVRAVEVKQAMRQFVARHRFYYEAKFHKEMKT